MTTNILQNFIPCYSPAEMFRLGIFGGAYFQILTSLPDAFIEETTGLLLYKVSQDKKNNQYGVVSGSSLAWWLEKDLIHPDDPNGWVEWYIKFYYGRVHSDDSRQIHRFRSFVTRHIAMLRSYERKGKDSLKTKQNLLHWAWDYRINPIW